MVTVDIYTLPTGCLISFPQTMEQFTSEQVRQMAPPAFLNRYLSGKRIPPPYGIYELKGVLAVAVASLIYDHVRTLDTEVSDVWASLRTSRGIKIVFLIGRYAADMALLYSAYGERFFDLICAFSEHRFSAERRCYRSESHCQSLPWYIIYRANFCLNTLYRGVCTLSMASKRGYSKHKMM